MQGNRFTCPQGIVAVPAPLPAAATHGLLCYTGANNATVIAATVDLSSFTAHNISEFLQVQGASTSMHRFSISRPLKGQLSGAVRPYQFLTAVHDGRAQHWLCSVGCVCAWRKKLTCRKDRGTLLPFQSWSFCSKIAPEPHPLTAQRQRSQAAASTEAP